MKDIHQPRDIAREFIEENKIQEGFIVINTMSESVKDAVEGVFSAMADVVDYIQEAHLKINELVCFRLGGSGLRHVEIL